MFKPSLIPFRSLAGLASLALALSACNQGVETSGPEESRAPAAQAPQSSGAPVKLSIDDGQALQGKQLEDFLKAKSETRELGTPEAPKDQPAPLAKGAYNACNINFNDPAAIRRMIDKAYMYYATSPWYSQYCSPAYAYVTPTNYNNYYLMPEESNVCVGSYGKMGYGTISNCQNQKSADLFPRYAGIATTTDGAVGIKVNMANTRNFKLNSFVGKGGTITVYAYRVGIGWWYWGPLPSNNTYWTFSNADNVTEVVFHSSNMKDPYYIDNVVITPY